MAVRRAGTFLPLASAVALLGAPFVSTEADPPGSAKPLWSSDFESDVPLPAPGDCWDKGCWQDVSPAAAKQFGAANARWTGRGGRFQLITDPVEVSAATIGDYMSNRIVTVMGPSGEPTRALYQRISRNANGADPMGTSVAQNVLQISPAAQDGDFYMSYWIKLQPDLPDVMNGLPPGPGVKNGGTWRSLFAFKTGGQSRWGGPADDGDYRVEVYVMTYGGGTPYWAVFGDNVAGGNDRLVNHWSVENRDVPVPVGEWFKFEIFWHRSAGAEGRVWVAVDGQAIADHSGPNKGARGLPVNRILAPLLYSGSYMPIYQWVDDIEIWEGLPPAADDALPADHAPAGDNRPSAAH